MSFSLHPQLANDTIEIADLQLCKLLLMNDARYPWLILVPRVENAIEWHDLSQTAQTALFSEVMQLAKTIAALPNVEKTNIGALGNVVSQLHVHIIGRNSKDAAWPKPVWGIGEAVKYEAKKAEELTDKIKTALGFHL